MASSVALQGHSYVFVCCLLWKSVLSSTNNSVNASEDLINKQTKQIGTSDVKNGNITEHLKLTLVPLHNSSITFVNTTDDSSHVKRTVFNQEKETSFETVLNNSIVISKADSGKESNLRDNLNDELTNSSYLIELTSTDDNRLQSNKSTTETYFIPSVNNKTDKHTRFNQINVTDSHTTDRTRLDVSQSKSTPKRIDLSSDKSKHKILRHLNLVPIEDEPFGGVLWKNNSKYVMSVCIPIGVGIAGAACIMGMAYAARRCYKNERKIQEIRAALQQQICENRNDETVLLDTSDDEI